MIEEEEVRPARTGRLEKLPLDPLSVGDLRDYIAELEAEILRAKTLIGQKEGARSIANSFFKK